MILHYDTYRYHPTRGAVLVRAGQEVPEGKGWAKTPAEAGLVGVQHDKHGAVFVPGTPGEDADPDLVEAAIAELEGREPDSIETIAAAEAAKEPGRPWIPIPDNWEQIPWFSLRKLVIDLTDVPPGNKVEASASIRAELAHRATREG